MRPEAADSCAGGASDFTQCVHRDSRQRTGVVSRSRQTERAIINCLRNRQVLGASEVQQDAGIEIAGSCPHHQPAAGVKAIVVSRLRPPFTAVMLAPLPRCASRTRLFAVAEPASRASSSIKYSHDNP
jgi:hypothetical protein